MRQDSATKAYLQRRLAEGKTVRDIKRSSQRGGPEDLVMSFAIPGSVEVGC
jgi:hypothetical protein